MGRIIDALDPESQTHWFTYDPAGDLLEHVEDMGQGPRCARYNGALIQYDAVGNLTDRQQGEEDHTRFTWDDQNRLKMVRKPDDTRVTMTYDALGRRCTKTVNGKKKIFHWDGDALLSEQQEDAKAREYVYYPGTFEPLAVIDEDGQIYYYHNDINGLPQELTKPSGTVVWSATYDAMGRVEQILADEVAQPLRMQGQYWDSEIDLCYNRYRYFDPQTCSFISQDPLGLAAGENIYAYGPNVWRWADPLCLEANVKVNGTKVHVEIPISYRGEGATDATVNAYNEAIENTWSGKFGKYDVTTKVIPGKGKNKIDIPLAHGRSNVVTHTRHILGIKFSERQTGTWFAYRRNSMKVAAHEAGHLMGLEDKYKDPDPNQYCLYCYSEIPSSWKGNIMAHSRGMPDERSIKEILKKHKYK